MRFNEFKNREYKAGTSEKYQFLRKQCLKDRERITRKLNRKIYNDGVKDKITAKVLAAVLDIIYDDDKGLLVADDSIE